MNPTIKSRWLDYVMNATSHRLSGLEAGSNVSAKGDCKNYLEEFKENDIRYPIGMATYSMAVWIYWTVVVVSAETGSDPEFSCVNTVELPFE